jgi:hypothetical protein
MDPRGLIEDLVTRVAPNATLVGIAEDERQYRVTVAGTGGVVADCELPRQTVEAATRWGDARAQVAAALKQCADHVDVRIPDGRG